MSYTIVPLTQQYQALSDNFAKKKAVSDTGWLDIYNLQPRKYYSSFSFFIPPGTTSINFFFTARSISPEAGAGPYVYLSSRIGAPPTATRSQFESIDSTLPNVNDSLSAPTVKELQGSTGYMAKRSQYSGDRIWIVHDVTAEGVLPSSYKKDGGWVFVNLLDKNGYDSIEILSIASRIKVDPEQYNKWYDAQGFSESPPLDEKPNPDPTPKPEPPKEQEPPMTYEERKQACVDSGGIWLEMFPGMGVCRDGGAPIIEPTIPDKFSALLKEYQVIVDGVKYILSFRNQKYANNQWTGDAYYTFNGSSPEFLAKANSTDGKIVYMPEINFIGLIDDNSLILYQHVFKLEAL